MPDHGIAVLIFVVCALLLGALLKALLHGRKFPYTVALLLAGILLASLDREGLFGAGSVHALFTQIAAVDPELILYLFLPTLIFQSAYAMEPHLFLRAAGQITLLAVAGLILSMVLTALAVSWLLPWGFGAALLFGALISATDPVAVVALLREKSSRKRLETLIEGESLLNDGTAIVFFALFYGFALGAGAGPGAADVVLGFLWVVTAGLGVGVAVGGITLLVIGRLFNQPLVEISLTIGAAYVTFFIAEALHVSGVIALVALALSFASVGRTRISPEVSGFLQQFWEMMAYVANTLIFLIVGIIIAINVTPDSPRLWLTLALLYPALVVIRALSIALLTPLLARMGVGFTASKGAVLVWGGLRGAISLSLALALAQDSAVPETLREEILFLTAGIVVLTIVLNGTTIGWLLQRLGLDRLPPANEASVAKAEKSLDQQMRSFLPQLRRNPFFNALGTKTLESLSAVASTRRPPDALSGGDVEIAFLRRLLEIERSDYWHQFEQGHIGRQAARLLTQSVEQALDNAPVIAPRYGLEAILTVPRPPAWLHRLPMVHHSLDTWIFHRLSLGYDVARGFVEAQEEVRRHLRELAPSGGAAAQVETMLEQNRSQAFAFTRRVGEHLPDLVRSLQSRAARRLLLNHRRALIWQMHREGILEEAEARRFVEEIEQQMAAMSTEETT